MSAKGSTVRSGHLYVKGQRTAEHAECPTLPDDENFKKMQELQKAHQNAIVELIRICLRLKSRRALSAVRFQDLSGRQ
jgi:hypothetical protein